MDEQFGEWMRRFGFTEKEIETYDAVLECGPATAKEIADQTDVSKRHVYNITEELERREFVVINDFVNPTRIEPAEPDRIYRTLREEAERMYQTLELRYQRQDGRREGVNVLKSRNAVVRRIRTMISSAENRVAISLPSEIVTTLEDDLRNAMDDGVTILLLLFGGHHGNEAVPDVSLTGVGDVVRYRDNEAPVLVAQDRKTGLVSRRGAMTQPQSQVNAIFFGKSYLERVVFSVLMNTDWILADEVHTRPPDELPHTYTHIRQAVINAALHERAGHSLRAEVEVRGDSDSERTEPLSGDVVGLKQRLVEPTTDPKPGQCSLDVWDGNERRRIGGIHAHMEDYRAYSITLYRDD